MRSKVVQQDKHREEEMRFLLDQQLSGGQNIKQFCEANNLSTAVFYYWQKKFRQRGANTTDKAGFLELGLRADSPAGQVFAEYKGIRFYQEPSAAFLRQLIG